MRKDFDEEWIELEDEVETIDEIAIDYASKGRGPKNFGFARTHGMDGFGYPELCLMDYYSPDEAAYILLNFADFVLNCPEEDLVDGTFDFYGVHEFYDDRGNLVHKIGCIGGWLNGEEVVCLQELDEDDLPIHPGAEFLPS